MFLVTTASQQYWDKTKPILFLGQWCKRYRDRHQWETLNYQTLPYHTDDSEQQYKNSFYIKSITEALLVTLADQLNHIHKTKHSLRYWRIILAPWLKSFVYILYDRYLSIKLAAEHLISNTWVVPMNDVAWLPRDFSEYERYLGDENYQHYLFSSIIQCLALFPFEIKPGSTPLQSNLPSSNKLKSGIRRLFLYFQRFIPSCLNRVVLIDSYFDKKNLSKLQLSLGQIPYLLTPPQPSVDADVNLTQRLQIQLDSQDDEFKILLQKIIPFQLPIVYLEGYPSMRAAGYALYPKKPDKIVTANAHMANEAFKFWAAEQDQEKPCLYISQHGGNDGAKRWCTYEDHCRDISRQFISWGWDDGKNTNTVKLPASKLVRYSNYRRNSYSDGHILYIPYASVRYPYSCQAMPQGPQYQRFLDQQLLFFSALDVEVRKIILPRFINSHAFDWDEEAFIRDQFPELIDYQGTASFQDQLLQARLCICTYHATTMLESFAANIPTLIFWDPSVWALRDYAKPYYQILVDANILFYSPQKAAEHLNCIYKDPKAWWMQDDVQAVRKQFCRRYALSSSNWKAQWRQFLTE